MAIPSLQNVGYKVDTNEILKNINLDVNENEFITITGPSGGGKSKDNSYFTNCDNWRNLL